jgi:hypothetical protein
MRTVAFGIVVGLACCVVPSPVEAAAPERDCRSRQRHVGQRAARRDGGSFQFRAHLEETRCRD